MVSTKVINKSGCNYKMLENRKQRHSNSYVVRVLKKMRIQYGSKYHCKALPKYYSNKYSVWCIFKKYSTFTTTLDGIKAFSTTMVQVKLNVVTFVCDVITIPCSIRWTIELYLCMKFNVREREIFSSNVLEINVLNVV